MLGLVITQTLRRGWRAGHFVALAPLFSDLPIILLSVAVIELLPHAALGWLGIAGGLFVVYLGVESVRATPHHDAFERDRDELVVHGSNAGAPRDVLWRAVLTNLFNPHPYLFWATAGAQLLLRALASSGPVGAALFLSGFYTVLVGSKLLVALLVSRSRNWLGGRGYRRVLLGSGILLAGLGLLLLYDGARALLTGG
jgi:threonine/homoserine/homoserine lactone efflux protein